MKYELFTPLAIYQLGQRPNQEDCIYPELDHATTDDRLFIVCDGMGGMAKGEVASATVCQAVHRYINSKTDANAPFTDSMMSDAMAYAYTALNAKATDPADKKMGTTFTMLYFHAGGIMAAHIGDSRYYHIRPDEHRVIYRSKDHSLVFSMFETGQITEEEMATSNSKNILLRAVMPWQQTPQMPDIVHIKDVRPDDWFLLLSDGMVEDMTDKEILDVLCNNTLTDEQKRNYFLVKTSQNNDNHSAYFIHVKGVTSELIDRQEPDDEEAARANHPLFRQRQHADGAPTSDSGEPITDTNPTPVVVVKGGSTASTATSQTSASPTPRYAGKPTSKGSKKGILWGAIIALIIVGAAFAFFFSNNKSESEPAAPTAPSSIQEGQVDAVGGGERVERGPNAQRVDPQRPDVNLDSVVNGIPTTNNGNNGNGKKNEKTGTAEGQVKTGETKPTFGFEEADDKVRKALEDSIKKAKFKKSVIQGKNKTEEEGSTPPTDGKSSKQNQQDLIDEAYF